MLIAKVPRYFAFVVFQTVTESVIFPPFLGAHRMGKKVGVRGFSKHFFVSPLPASQKPLDFFPDQSLSSWILFFEMDWSGKDRYLRGRFSVRLLPGGISHEDQGKGLGY